MTVPPSSTADRASAPSAVASAVSASAASESGSGEGSAVPVISCRGLWKLYGGDASADSPERWLAAREAPPSHEQALAAGYVPAVRDVSLDIGRGEMLVVMGLSGSGKSTLVRCLSRLVEASAGEIVVEGQDLRALDERGLIEIRRSKMGMVFQNFALLPHRTVLDNVAYPLEMRGQDRHARRERALEVIRLVGLEGREEHFPRELSGGQQQRVGIARSLAIEPDIWFLDEPFSALDPLIRRDMQDEFLRLQAMLGKTIVFITHDFDEALRLADRIAIMKDGTVEQVDTPDRIVLAPATDYVRRFTEEIDRARVVHAGTLAEALAGAAPAGEPIAAGATIHALARRLVDDTAASYPIAAGDGTLIGTLSRERALDVLLGPRP